MDDLRSPRELADMEQRSVGELFKELAADAGVLVRKEVELATTEVTGRAKVAAKDGALVAAGAACAYFAVLLLLGALVVGVGRFMPLWASALLVGAVLAVLAATLAVFGLQRLKRVETKPRETIRTLEENHRWLREQLSR